MESSSLMYRDFILSHTDLVTFELILPTSGKL